MIVPALLMASLSAAPLTCNTIDADGIATSYAISFIDEAEPSIAFTKVGSDAGEAILVTDVDMSEPTKPTFSVVLDGRQLSVRVWGGFYRAMSQIDAVDVDGDTQGLRFLIGTCSQGGDFSPAEYQFTAPRYPSVDGQKVQNCFGVTLDGRVFTFRNRRKQNGNSESYFQWNEQGETAATFEFVSRPFPSLPRKGNIYRNWTSFDPANGETSPSFVEEFSVNEASLRAATTIDFVSLEAGDGPAMVARAHCGQFTVERSG